MRSSDIISHNIPPLKTSDPVTLALRMMGEFHVRHLPVISENKLLGLLSEDDILSHHVIEETVGALSFPLARPFVKDHQHLFEVMKVVTEFNLTIVPVIDGEENYLGNITREDALNFFASETDVLEPGGIIVIEVNTKDYLLSELARIIEQHNAKILCTFIKTRDDSNKMELTVKINQTDLQPIILSLNRYDYVVKETYTEAEYSEDLKERYDALMNYLNI